MAGKNTAVFGIYRTAEQVENAVDALRGAGFRNTDISVLFPENVGTKDFAVEKGTKAPEGTATGAGTGVVIGGTLGWLAGIGALAIPGLGPFIAAGPIVAALAGVGAGGVVGAVTGAVGAAFETVIRGPLTAGLDVPSSASVTVSFGVRAPTAPAYACVTTGVVVVWSTLPFPSKSHPYVAMPPGASASREPEPLKVTCCPRVPLVGDASKAAVGAPDATVSCFDATSGVPPLSSETRTRTVNTPGAS